MNITDEQVYALIVAALCGDIIGTIAYGRGYSYVRYWLTGAVLFPLALARVLMLPPNRQVLDKRALAGGQVKRCGACAELVRAQAKVCRYCGSSDFPGDDTRMITRREALDRVAK